MSDATGIKPTVHGALSSPMRLELVGLFTDREMLSIADMAVRLGRPATSLYHHVRVLEEAGVLRQAGTRPKGKRRENLYQLTENLVDLDVDRSDPGAASHARQAMAAALRMGERDFGAALERDDVEDEGPLRELMGMRMHIRASAKVLTRLNKHLDAIQDLMRELADAGAEPGPEDRFVSLTLLLAPLRGRRANEPQGDPS